MPDSPVPVVVLATTDRTERDVAILTALIDAPDVVAVIHDLHPGADGERELVRRVLTLDGESRTVIPLEHACPGCAMRQDAVPALAEQLHRRPAGVVLALPVGAEILPATRTLAAAIGCGALAGARLAGTAAVLAGTSLLDSLDDGDEAVVSHLVAAAVLVTSGADPRAADVVEALRTPTSQVVADVCEPWLPAALALEHDDAALERVSDPVTLGRGHGLRQAAELDGGGRVAASGVWELELRSARPFHPARLLGVARDLGAQGAVSRGRFWVPNRPDSVCGWDAVCGQVAVGVAGAWPTDERETYLTVVGFDADVVAVRTAFESALLTDAELADGLAPWLGRPDPLAEYLPDPAALHDVDDVA